MSTNKRTILELHLHSHGDLQMGPRSIGSEEPAEEETESGRGIPTGSLMLAVVGAVAFVLLRRRSRRRREEEEMAVEQKNLDRWIPTR